MSAAQRFHVRALDPSGAPVALDLQAADHDDAERQAAARGLLVVSARVDRPAGARPMRLRLRGARARRFPLVLFSQEIRSLLAAGLHLVEAIETLAENDESGDMRRVLAPLLAGLREGKPLSTMLEAQPQAFPPLYVATIRASERTGAMVESLGRYIDYAERMDAVRKKLIAASIYPVLLMGAGLLVTLFLLGYVVPKFSHIYADSGRDLPWLSTLLLSWGQAVERHGLVVAAVVLATIGAAVILVRGSGAHVSALAWRLPAIGRRLLVYELARFYRTLGMLLSGGTPIVPALDMAAALLHPALRPRLAAAREAIRRGTAISQAMSTNGLTTPVAVRLLHVGERSGEMASMMDRIAEFYDEALARWVEWFTRLFEPLLMAAIGLVIGTIVVLMYMPIFELAGSLQ